MVVPPVVAGLKGLLPVLQEHKEFLEALVSLMGGG